MKKRPPPKKSKKKKPSVIFGVYREGWIIILVIFLLIGLVAFILGRDSGSVETETITAEISNVWIEEVQSEEGGYRIYRIRLKQKNEELTCQVSPIMIGQLHQLEISKSYEFSVSKTPTQCFVTGVTIIDEEKNS